MLESQASVPPVPRFLATLSRKTTSGRFIPEIDGLRFVAIFLVIGGHLRYFLDKQGGGAYAGRLSSNTLAEMLGRGGIGVQIFFSISGFILALPFAAMHLRGTRAPSLRAYFLRRVTRLEPPYLLALVMFFVLRVSFQHASARDLLPHLLASCAYLHNIIYRADSTVLAVAWSLEVEIQFYLLVPLLAQVFRIRSRVTRRLVIIGAAMAFAALRAFVLSKHGVAAELTIVGQLPFFLVGFLVADLFLDDWREQPEVMLLADLLAWFAILALLFGFPQRYELAVLAFPVCVFFIAFGAFRGIVCRQFLRNPYISTIGGMCYTIYLLHFPIITSIGLATKHWVVHGDVFVIDLLRLGVVVLPIVLAFSVLYFVAIERPCMERDWPQRMWRRFRRPADQSDAA